MKTTRRELLQLGGGTAIGLAGLGWVSALRAEEAKDRPRIGVCDWSLGAKRKAVFEQAKALGLEGVQISPDLKGGKLSYADPAEQELYKDIVKQTGVQVASVGLTVTNSFPLASDPRGAAWLEQTIDAAAALGCKTTLLACFANGDLLAGKELKKKDVDELVARLKDAAPKAKAKGVVLGLESWLSAKDTMMILDRVDSPAMGMYYDIANSTLRGYDVPAEIRQLKDRICEFHFKDNKGPLGQGDVKIEPVCEAIREIGFKGWIVLEGHFGDRAACMRANAATARKLLKIAD